MPQSGCHRCLASTIAALVVDGGPSREAVAGTSSCRLELMKQDVGLLTILCCWSRVRLVTQATLSMLRSGARDVCFGAFYSTVPALANLTFIIVRCWGLRLPNHEAFCSVQATARPTMDATGTAIDVDG